MNPSQELQNSIEQYRKLHALPQNYFRGHSLLAHIPDLSYLAQNSNAASLLDYGCGKGEVWKEHGLRRLLKLRKVFLYDPGIPEFKNKPGVPADIVICIDVMEHIPENCVDEVLKDIDNLSKKAIFFAISTRTSSKTLPNGENAHVTVKPEEWWWEKLNKINKFVVARFTS